VFKGRSVEGSGTGVPRSWLSWVNEPPRR
jgi:hypothetical protein